MLAGLRRQNGDVDRDTVGLINDIVDPVGIVGEFLPARHQLFQLIDHVGVMMTAGVG